MIPYWNVPLVDVGGMLLPTFGVLVCIGVLVAHFALIHRAARSGLNRAWAAEMSLAMVAAGGVGAVLFKLLYRPDLLAAGFAAAFANLPGFSSFGGLFFALASAFAYLRFRHVEAPARWKYLDAAAFAFPFGWVFGRAGCFLLHDHPGIRAEGLLAVDYPGGARYDLGLLEALLMALLGIVFASLGRAIRRPGFFLVALLAIYGPFRIALDALHVDPPRYAGISVDQWSGGLVTALAVFFSRRTARVSYN